MRGPAINVPEPRQAREEELEVVRRQAAEIGDAIAAIGIVRLSPSPDASTSSPSSLSD